MARTKRARSVRTHKFSTGVYKIETDVEYYGWCQQPDDPGDPPDLKLWISPQSKGRERLDTIIHESLHAELPKLTEKEVTACASNIARLLWRLGYREKRDG